MNNVQTLMLFLWLTSALSGIFAYKSFFAIKDFLKIRQRRKTYAYLEVAKNDNVCKGPHNWDKMKLAMPPLPADLYTICKDCGFVAYEEGLYKLNKPALDIFKNNLKMRHEKLEKYNLVTRKQKELLNEVMKKMIKQNVESFDGDLHKNIELLQNFFRKSVLEIDVLYANLSKELDDVPKDG